MPIHHHSSVRPEEKAAIDQAFQGCRTLISEVMEEYWHTGRRPHLYKTRIQEFFGTEMSFSQLKSKLQALQNFLDTEMTTVTTAISIADQLSFSAGEYPVEHRYAEADYQNRQIAFRSKFFTAPQEERALTVFHELTHLALQTEDHEITTDDAEAQTRQLAKENGRAAVNSAHNFELFMKYALIPNLSSIEEKHQHYHDRFKNQLSRSQTDTVTFFPNMHCKRFAQKVFKTMQMLDENRRITDYFSPRR